MAKKRKNKNKQETAKQDIEINKKELGEEIIVKNAEGDPDTKARILIKNKIDYTPKVSVIIPVYNTEKYLKECLDSVINQSLKEIEIICVDDGSTDNSLEILKEYAAKDNRITVLTQENLYAGVARNAGMMVASGEYYHFLDSDDFVEDVIYGNLLTSDDDILVFKYNNFDTNTNTVTSITGIFNHTINNIEKINPKAYADKLFQLSNPMPWNKIVKSNIAKQVKFQNIKASNDIFFSFMSMAISSSILFIDSALVYYRYNRVESLKNTRDKSPKDFLQAYKYLKLRLENFFIYDNFAKSYYQSLISSSIWTIDNVKKKKDEVKLFIKNNILHEIDFSLVSDNLKNIFLFKLNNKIIVSLTSFPARINLVHISISSILNQSVKPDKVILWLATEQFPGKENDLPKELLNLTTQGLEIDWYHDIKSYKKLIPTLKKYPNDIIVTADDDLVFSKNWLRKLMSEYDGKNILCHRITRMYSKEDIFKVLDRKFYLKNNKYIEEIKKESVFNKLSGGAGAVYPPNTFKNTDVLNEEKFIKLAPTSDDIWFWLQALLNNYKVKVVSDNEFNLNYIPNSQEVALWKINDVNNSKIFYEHFYNIINEYPKLKNIFIENNTDNKISYKLLNNQILDDKNKLCDWFKKRTGKVLDLDNPKTLNEKIQWMKLYDSTPLKTRLADKYLVREWIKEQIGEEYLIPLLGVYDKFEEIDFDKLPDRFVIKCNHGCGYNIIVKDKYKLDLEDTKNKLDKWMNENFAFKNGFELQYLNITPKIIIEEYIENESSGDLYDYKFWCFGGKVKYIQFLSDRNISGLKMAFYDTDWNKLDFTYDHPLDQKVINKPFNLDKLIELSNKLSRNFSYVRVDFYRLDSGKIYFGELTFTSASGAMRWNKNDIDLKLGKMVKLPKLAYNIYTGEYYKPKKTSIFKKTLKLLNNKKSDFVEYSDVLNVCRIDIKNHGFKNNKVQIIQNTNEIKAISTEKSNGYSFIGNDNIIKFKTIKRGKLVIDLLNDNENITYNQIKLNGKNLLEKPFNITTNNPFKIKKYVLHNQKFKLEIDYKTNISNDIIKQQLLKYYSDVTLIQILLNNFNNIENIISKAKTIQNTLNQSKFRIDLKNIGDKNNTFEFISYSDDINMQKPAWLSANDGQGIVIHGNYGNKTIKLKVIGSGKAFIRFMAPDIRTNNIRLPLFVSYLNIKLNDKDILTNISASHDRFITYDFNVADGEEVTIAFDSFKYDYSSDELDNIIALYGGNKDILNLIKSNISLDSLLNTVNKIKKELNEFKINIRNVRTPENNIELINNNSKINVSTPAWFSNDKGNGSVLTSQNYKDNFKVKAIGNGNLSFKFMGIDKIFNNERIPLYVNYQSIKINGKEILKEPTIAWHDKAFTYEMKVKDGEVIDVEVIRSPYPYTKNELRDLITKLSNGVEPKDINNIIENIIKNRLEYEKSIKSKEPNKIFSITKEKYKTRYYFLGLKYVKFNTRREILDLIKEENAKLKKEIEQLKNRIG